MTHQNAQIVITGAAVASSLGLTREQTWQGILQGRSGMRALSAMESPLPAGKDGGQAIDLPDDFAPTLPREVRYLQWTIADALKDAGLLERSPYASDRAACLLGTTLHGMRAAGRYLRSNSYGALQEFLAGSTLQNGAAPFALAGFNATTCSACSSSLGSIAMAVTMLQSGEADLVIAGGYDTISEYVYGGFNSLRLVADGPLRPFAKGRQGMKLAEGYGIVVLERASDAAQRGQKSLATILGWGESADAHHLTQPHPQGDGAARAIDEAIRRAGLRPADIDLIAAHATGTPDNDAGEYTAFLRVFGERLPQIPVTAFKSHLGHTLGAAGAVELILAAMALRDQVVPACANVTATDVEFPNLHLAVGQPRAASLRTSLNTSLGFGGANTCVVLGVSSTSAKRTEAVADSIQVMETPTSAAGGQDVFITGVGVIAPGISDNNALLARIHSEAPPAWLADTGSVPDSAIEGLLNARRVRRMSDYVKLTLGSATLALRDAGISDIPEFARDCAAVLGSTHGSSNYSASYYGQIIAEGLMAANPMLFAEAVPNAGAAQLSLMLSLKGACQTVIGTRTAGLDALALAALRIRSGVWDHAIVSAGEEYCELVNQTYRHCGNHAVAAGSAPFSGQQGFTTGAGAVTFILESKASIDRRQGVSRGRIELTAAARGTRPDAIDTAVRVLNHLGQPAHVLSSACGTWIDRSEAAAVRRAGGRSVSSIYGHIAETFSASPLIGIAAVLLTRRLPKLFGQAPDALLAGSQQPIESFAAICTDFTGSVSGVKIAL